MPLLLRSLMLPSPLCIVLCVLLRSGGRARAQIGECHHKDQDYAWNTMEELVPLGKGNGILVHDGSYNWKCLQDIDTFNMLAYPTEVEIKCQEMRLEVVRKVGNKPIRVMVPFNRTLYYATKDSGLQTPLQLSSKLPTLNYEFSMPEIAQWIKQNIKSHQVQAISLVKTDESSRSYPSAILALEDPDRVSVFVFKYTDPHDVRKSNTSNVGYFPHPVNAIYLKRNKFQSRVSLIVFFENYYGKTYLPLKQKPSPNTELSVFPILPIQGMFGCPIHLCWWPVFNDILYYNSAYYFFQGRWMFCMEEGESKPLTLSPSKVYDLRQLAIHYTVQAAYYDFSVKSVVFIRQSKSVIHLETVSIEKKNELVTITPRTDVRLAQLTVDSKVQVISAVHCNSTRDTKLWIVYRREQNDMPIVIGYEFLQPDNQYAENVKIKSLSHGSISAVFYRHQSAHLYLVSGFHMYVYKEADFERLDQTMCSVTTVAHFFNCSDSYYNMERMAGHSKLKLFQSKTKYFKSARDHHDGGEFLPGQCNFFPEMPLDVIPFKEKEHPEKPTHGPSFRREYAWMIGALVGGILLTVACFYGISAASSICASGRNKKSNDNDRRSVESRLRAFIKSRLFKEGVSSSGPTSSSQTGSNVDQSADSKRPTTSAKSRRSEIEDGRVSKSPAKQGHSSHRQTARSSRPK